jgi:hypothetical protein
VQYGNFTADSAGSAGRAEKYSHLREFETELPQFFVSGAYQYVLA